MLFKYITFLLGLTDVFFQSKLNCIQALHVFNACIPWKSNRKKLCYFSPVTIILTCTLILMRKEQMCPNFRLICSQIRTLCFCGKPLRANQIVWSLTADINNRFSSRFPPDLSSALSMQHWIINLIMLISLVKMLCNGLIKSCSPGDPASQKDEGISVDPWLCDWWMLVASWRLVYISCPRIPGRPESVSANIQLAHTNAPVCFLQISCLSCWI